MKTLMLLIAIVSPSAFGLDIPSLNWAQRSDWINVKTNIPNAIGNGIADDTAAIQAVLSATNVGKTVYLPAGTYRITGTLAMTNNTAVSVIGCGRDTKIVWDGTNGGIMFVSNGNPYSKYNGLSWDGANKAAVGFDHASKTLFETEIQHLNESYRNFTNAGIRIGINQVQAAAEVIYRNCLFTNCATGIAISTFNDYDNTIDHCQFENCGIAVYGNHGNVYARNSHFQGSTVADFSILPEHDDSIRRCTSSGSYVFVKQLGSVCALTLQDCQVANWSGPYAAYVSDGPILIFDCVFSRSTINPVYANQSQKIILCNNSPATTNQLLTGQPHSVYVITNRQTSGVLSNANQTFLQQTVAIPGHIFDAKLDFGAVGNGITDDTTAIQNTINAAQSFGNGSMAYIPAGSYYISQTLLVQGSSYYVGGSGRKTCLNWHGSAGLPFMVVSNVTGVTLCDMGVGTHDCTVGNNGDDIRITSSGGACSVSVDGVYVYGKGDNDPNSHGLRIDSLPSGSTVDVPVVQGNIWITNCADASLIFHVSYEGTVTVRGPTGTNSPAGFLTRLATSSTPALQVMDNQSIVMSDFYMEQLPYTAATFSGNTNGPFGTVTIQSPKVGSSTNLPVFDITGYAGRIYYGQTQFYLTPTNTLFKSTSTPSLQLILSGCVWYDTFPLFNIDTVTPTIMGNYGIPNAIADSGVTTAAMAGIGSALDDLSRLGAMEVGPINPITHVAKATNLHIKNLFIGP